MPKTTKITLSPEDAAVVLDIVTKLSGPVSPDAAAVALRQARYLVPKLTEAFDAAGIAADDVERPEIPFMVPGSKHKPATH
jgi:hypothetical protein